MKRSTHISMLGLIMCSLMLSTTNAYSGSYEKFVIKLVDAVTDKPVTGALVTFIKDEYRMEASTDKSGYVTLWNPPFSEEDNLGGFIKCEVDADGYIPFDSFGPLYQRVIALSRLEPPPSFEEPEVIEKETMVFVP